MKTLVQNKKVKFNYEILETLKPGIELLGIEVKTLRGGQGSLEGSHITIRGNEAYLVGAVIPPYQPQNTPSGYEDARVRRLLLTKKEIAILNGFESHKGLTIVPLSVYSTGRHLKVSIAVVRGKKKYDKRETIKKRQDEREMGRSLKNK